MPIYFYSTIEQPYGCFSNFSRHGFALGGLYWLTVEHYFQAQKFPNHTHGEAIRLAKTPKQAKSMGNDRSKPLRADWETVKDEIMRRGVLGKFTTHTDIRRILLETGDALIYETAPGDYYWGTGADGSGLNRLGEILMEVRALLRQNS